MKESALSHGDEYDTVLYDETAFSDVSDLTLDTESFNDIVGLEPAYFTGIVPSIVLPTQIIMFFYFAESV